MGNLLSQIKYFTTAGSCRLQLQFPNQFPSSITQSAYFQEENMPIGGDATSEKESYFFGFLGFLLVGFLAVFVFGESEEILLAVVLRVFSGSTKIFSSSTSVSGLLDCL